MAFLLGCVFVFEFVLRPSKVTQHFAATASTQIMEEFGGLTASKSDLYTRLPDAVEEGHSDYDATKPSTTRAALLSDDQLSSRSSDASSPRKESYQDSTSAALSHGNVQSQPGGGSGGDSSRAAAADADVAVSPQSDGSRLKAQKDIESVVSKDTLALDDTRPQPQTYRGMSGEPSVPCRCSRWLAYSFSTINQLNFLSLTAETSENASLENA